MISLLCKTVLKPTTLRTQICYRNTHIQAVPDWAHPRNRSLRLTRQLDSTMASKKGFTKNCTDCCNNLCFDIPAFSCKSLSFRSVLCSYCTSHKETDLNIPMNKIYLGVISTHCFEAFVKTGHVPSLKVSFEDPCQGLPLRADFQSCRHHRSRSLYGIFLSFFERFRASRSSLPCWSILEPHTDQRPGRPSPLLCPGLIPANVLVKFIRHHLW